jgi:hypothetical protein
MEKTKFDNSLLDAMLEEEAWKNISREGKLTESLLEKYRSKLDWEAVTTNSNIHWTPAMLERFKYNIDWQQMSSWASADLLCPEIVGRYADRWDWKELSRNTELPLETIGLFADRLDWGELIERYNSSENPIFGRAFLETYADYIPADRLKDSTLWYALVEERGKELKRALFMEA